MGVTYIAVEPEDANQDCSPIALVAVLKHKKALSLPRRAFNFEHLTWHLLGEDTEGHIGGVQRYGIPQIRFSVAFISSAQQMYPLEATSEFGPMVSNNFVFNKKKNEQRKKHYFPFN